MRPEPVDQGGAGECGRDGPASARDEAGALGSEQAGLGGGVPRRGVRPGYSIRNQLIDGPNISFSVVTPPMI